MMNFTELLNNVNTMTSATTGDATTVATRTTEALQKFKDTNDLYDSMKQGLITGGKAKDDAEAENLMVSMGLVKTDLTAKEAELKAAIQKEEDAKAESKFYEMASKAMQLQAALEGIANQNAPAPVESDLDKLIKLQVLQMSNNQQPQNSSKLEEECIKQITDALCDAIKTEATPAPAPAPAPAPTYYRPSNKEQYESHKAVTRSKSAERGQLYADMKAGRISLGQYMAGCAATWSDAASEHADITARRRGYYI